MQTYNGWQNLPTEQSKDIWYELKSAKQSQKALLLISDTGLGKSNTIKQFAIKNKAHTYTVVVGDSYKLSDVVDAILFELGVHQFEYRTGVRGKLSLIAKKLQEVKAISGKPVIILDEAENLKPSVLKMIKELYDSVIEHSSIVMIGTAQILETIHNKRKRNRQSVPQLWRRFKAGVRYISPLEKARDFTPFFDLHIPDQENLKDLLMEMYDNYRELNNYLDPVLRYASDNGIEVTEELFRMIHNLPAKKMRKAS